MGKIVEPGQRRQRNVRLEWEGKWEKLPIAHDVEEGVELTLIPIIKVFAA